MFDIANLSLGVIILLLRVAVVFLLYFFLWQVLRVVSNDPVPRRSRANRTHQ